MLKRLHFAGTFVDTEAKKKKKHKAPYLRLACSVYLKETVNTQVV